MRSSVISLSSGFISDGSRLTDLTSPFAVIFTVTIPPPAAPSTSMRSSSACIASILDLSSLACFIKPKKSAISRLSLRAAHPPNPTLPLSPGKGEGRDGALQIVVHIVRPAMGAERRPAIVNRHFGRQLVIIIGSRDRRCRLRFWPPHGHDLGARKPRQHALHHRISLDAALEFLVARVELRPHRRLAGFRRDRHHPASPGKSREPLTEVADQRLGGARLQRDLQPAVFESYETYVSLKYGPKLQVALRADEGDQIGKSRKRRQWSGGRRLGAAANRIAHRRSCGRGKRVPRQCARSRPTLSRRRGRVREPHPTLLRREGRIGDGTGIRGPER